MKIGIVTEYFYPTLGGITENIYHFSKELLRRGHDFRVITGFRGMHGEVSKDALERMIFIGRNIPVFFNGSCGRLTVGLDLSNKMRAVLDREKFDIVHLHSPLFPTLPAVANMQANAPVVATFHTCTSGEMIYYRLYRKKLRKLLDRMAGRIAVSDCCARENNRYFDCRFDIIPNGVDCASWVGTGNRIKKIDDGKINILFLGRPDKRNGLDTLIFAFARVHRRHPNTRLIVVGDGPLSFHFRRLVPCEIRDAVFFEGQANGTRPEYTSIADIFCFVPAIASFGVTILEGMSAAKAIVASDIEAFRALLTNEKSALLVPPGNEGALAAAISRLVADPPLRKRLAAEARSMVAPYDWNRVAKMHLDYYDKILGR